MLEPYGIKELVQSGMVAIGRGGSITDRTLRLRPARPRAAANPSPEPAPVRYG
jgi:acetolactate synthase-1/3 small subunit